MGPMGMGSEAGPASERVAEDPGQESCQFGPARSAAEQVVQFVPDFPGPGGKYLPSRHQNNPKTPFFRLFLDFPARVRKEPLANLFKALGEVDCALPQGLAQEAFGPVSLDGSPDLAAGDDGATEVIRSQQINHHEAPDFLGAPGVYQLKFSIIPQRPPDQRFFVCRVQAERRLRPRARRRFRTWRPALVAIRFRKPCRRARLMLLG